MADRFPYNEKVMDHFTNPRNIGEIIDASGVGTVGNPVCGDVMKMYLKIENEIIVDIKFKTFGCLPAKERVVLSKGNWEPASEVSKGTLVVNSQGRETAVCQIYKRNYSGKLFTILPFVSPFNSFSVTSEHPILCVKREWVKGARLPGSRCRWLRFKEEDLFLTEPDFVKVSNLEKGDYLVFNVNREIKDNESLAKDTMRLMGYYLSEGYITAQESVVAFAFHKKEKAFIKEVQVLLEKVTGKKAKCRIRNNVVEVYICSRKLVKFLMNYCGKLAKNKILSPDILLLPFIKQWELIKTYMDGDGDAYRRRPDDSKTYRITTVSESLAIQVQEILARGGIFASIRQVLKQNCYIGKRKLRDSIQYIIAFKLARSNKFTHYNKKYFLVPIKNVTAENFKGHVYNFQVCGEPNSYLVKGFAVHNCGAAVATSSMVTEMVKGKSISEALKITNQAVAEALGGLPAIKMHCSVLAEEALRSALKDYYQKQGKPVPFEDKGHTHEREAH